MTLLLVLLAIAFRLRHAPPAPKAAGAAGGGEALPAEVPASYHGEH
jgi:hypothetical protein